jgi:hypothetical protein
MFETVDESEELVKKIQVDAHEAADSLGLGNDIGATILITDAMLQIAKAAIEATVAIGIERGWQQGWNPYIVEGHGYKTQEEADAAFAGIVRARCKPIFKAWRLG